MPQDVPYNALSPPDIYAEEVAGLQNQLHAAQDPAVAGREALARIMMTLAMPLSARGMTTPRGPWTPSVQAPRVRREAKQDGDDGAGQHVYEALLGRTRKPGQAVGEPGSGWWMVGGQPIPKPTNVLPHLVAGGVGYGIYNLLGGPSWEDIQRVKRSYEPGTPEYEAQQKHAAGVRERSRQDQQARDASKEELGFFYGPEALQYGLPHGMEGMRRLGQLPGRERTLPSVNAIPFPPDPNKP